LQPWAAYLPAALLTLAGVLAPLGYLVLRAASVQPGELANMILRPRIAVLLWNTAALGVSVLAMGTLIALPLAWLTTRTALPGRRLATLLAVAPLAIPGYVMAYGLIGAAHPQGPLAAALPWTPPRPDGFWGATLALGLYTFPYLFLNLRAAMIALDPALEEVARSLGQPPRRVFRRVVLPQLRPALGAGALIVGLHVLGDYGVVSLMRFQTLSFAVFDARHDRVYVCWLALIMIALTAGVLVVEARWLRGLVLHRTAAGAGRARRLRRLGAWNGPAWIALAALAAVAVLLPVASIVYWLARHAARHDPADLLATAWAAARAAGPAALAAALLALPLAHLSVRRPSRPSRALERVAYFGYAMPPMALGLALVMLSAPTPWYQSLLLLCAGYTIHFLAEAIGPIRSGLYQVSPRIEQAARSLGAAPARAFASVTWPLIQGRWLVAVALVFLSAMKELPITLLLAPPDFQTLAVKTWDKTREALLAEAAPYALAILAVSSTAVLLLIPAARSTPTRPDRS